MVREAGVRVFLNYIDRFTPVRQQILCYGSCSFWVRVRCFRRSIPFSVFVGDHAIFLITNTYLAFLGLATFINIERIGIIRLRFYTAHGDL